MDMDDLYLPKEHNSAMLVMFATQFVSWRDSWSAVAQYKSRSAMYSYSWYLRTGRLRVFDYFSLGLCLPITDRMIFSGKKISSHSHETV